MRDGSVGRNADPVLARRARISRWASFGRRAGYTLYALSLALFLIGMATGFHHPAAATGAAAGLVAGSVTLAPAVIVGYAVKAAERADAQDDW